MKYLHLFEAFTHSIKLSDVEAWLKKHNFKITDSEKNAGFKRWAEGGSWEDLVKDAKSIEAEYREIDLHTYKEHEISGENFSIKKLGNKEIFLNFTPDKRDNANRKAGYEE